MKIHKGESQEDKIDKWIDDPRNTTYWDPRGSVFRAWPVSATEVIIMDVVSNQTWRFTNAEISLKVRDGELVEIDFTRPMNLPTGKTKAVAFKPIDDGENSPTPSYKRYTAAPTNSRRDTGESAPADTGIHTGYAASVSPVAVRGAGEASGAHPPGQPAPLRRYTVKKKD